MDLVASKLQNDQRWLLAAAALCFLTAVILALVRGCSDALVGTVAGFGGGAIGGMSGIARTAPQKTPEADK